MVTISILHCHNHYEYLSGNTGGRTTKSTACRHLAAAAVGDGGDDGVDDRSDDIYIMMSVCLSEKSSLLGFSWFLVGFHGF